MRSVTDWMTDLIAHDIEVMRERAPHTGRHRYRRVALDPVVYADGSAITPSHESCARCGKVKRGSFDIR